MRTPQAIAVIAAGTMGAGIARRCPPAELSVVMIDVAEERIARACKAIPDGLQPMPADVARAPQNGEAVLAHSEEGATASDVDQAMNLACNDPVGPGATTHPPFAAHTRHDAQS